MTDLRRQYKEKTLDFGDTKENRRIRVEKHEESRRKQRERTFNKNRHIPESSNNIGIKKETQVPSDTGDRLTRLMKWKADRERRKKVEQTKKRPPFKVGVVHHRLYSPITKDGVVVQVQAHEKSTSRLQPPPSNAPRRVTRATEKRLMAKAAATKKAVTKASARDMATSRKQEAEKQEKSFAPVNCKFKAPAGLPKMPLFGLIPFESSSEEELSDFVISPKKKVSPAQESALQTWIVDDIDEEKVKTPESRIKKTEDVNNTVDSPIEAIQLRFSSDDQEVFNCSIQSKKQLGRSSSPNKSITKSISSPLNSSMPISAQSGSPSEPAFFSPYVVSSRGKSNARKEQQTRRGIGRSPSDDIPTKDTIMRNLNISLEEEERTAQYFQFILNKEIDRLNHLCDKWEEMKTKQNVTEDALGQINQAIGQTMLLMNKKFERFRGLCNECETGKGEMLVTCKDLQGFWDMMYMEVKDCDIRFEKLEKLRSQGWKEEQPVVKTVVKTVVKKKAPVKKKPNPTKQSSLAFMISERRKNMGRAVDHKIPETVLNSPLKPMKKDSARLSLLQKVQLSERSKRLSSPLAMMKISKICKTPEVQSDNRVSYVNSDQTPGKGILKHTKDSVDSESRAKSAYKVNFDDHVVLNEVPMDEETRTKLDLVAALARIDSYDYDQPNEPLRSSVERKLTYDDDSSDESESTQRDIEEQKILDMQNSKSVDENHIGKVTINIQAATPLQETLPDNNRGTPSLKKNLKRQSLANKDAQKTVTIANESLENSSTNLLRKTLQKQVSVHDQSESEDDGTTRILRNRTVTARDTPKGKRRSVRVSSIHETEHKENKSPIRTSRKSCLKVSIADEGKDHSKINLEDAIDQISLHETIDKKRRSSRKSIKFTEKDCTVCDNRPALPVTPYIRRSHTRSSESKGRRTFPEESVPWEISEKPPERIRRSQSKKV